MIRRPLALAASLLALLLWLAAPSAHGGDDEPAAEPQSSSFAVLSAALHDIDGVVRLDATFSLRFGTTLEEALHNGVTLPLVIEIEALQQRDYLWSKTVAHVEQRYLLSFNALTEQYLLHNRNTDAQFRLPSLAAVKAVLGSLSKFPFLDRNLLQGDERYLARIRVAIDSDRLPAPLRLMSYVSSEWDLHSEWYQWPLQLR